jgi:hypothetical protein
MSTSTAIFVIVCVVLVVIMMTRIASEVNKTRRQASALGDLRMLWRSTMIFYETEGVSAMFPDFYNNPSQARLVAGPWPKEIPMAESVKWEMNGPGFDRLNWYPVRQYTYAQYAVVGWATGYICSATGDFNNDGKTETFIAQGGQGMPYYNAIGPLEFYSLPPRTDESR